MTSLKEMFTLREVKNPAAINTAYRARIDNLVRQIMAAADNTDKMAAGSEVNRLTTELDILLGQFAQELMQ